MAPSATRKQPSQGAASPKTGAKRSSPKNYEIELDEALEDLVEPGEPETLEEAMDCKGIIMSGTPTGGQQTRFSPPARLRQSSFGNDADLACELPPEWTLTRFQEKVKPVLQEYFVSFDLEEASSQIQELLLTCPSPDEFGVLALRAALDKAKEQAQAQAVKLLCKLHKSKVLDTSALFRSFEKLLCSPCSTDASWVAP